MKQFANHPTAADLIEHIWVPDASAETSNHLASCLSCRKRFDEIARELNDSADANRLAADSVPETFWTRQRLSIQRSIRSSGTVPPRLFGLSRWSAGLAAAAGLVLLVAIGSWIARGSIDPAATHLAQGHSEASATETIAMTVPPPRQTDDVPLVLETKDFDPWTSSDELEAFRPVVEWESWIDGAQNTAKEGRS